MPEPQNYKNHTRFDPPWHFFIAPLLLLNIIFAIVAICPQLAGPCPSLRWWLVMAIVGLMAVGKARVALAWSHKTASSASKRSFASPRCCPPDLLARSQALTVRQIIGLRFASDDELPAWSSARSTRTSPRSRSSRPSTTGAPTTSASDHGSKTGCPHCAVNQQLTAQYTSR